jgi:hypothetical protein
VLVVRGTRKVLDRCVSVTSAAAESTVVLGDWYVTVLFWKPQLALFVNERTLLPVFVQFAPGVSLVPRFVEQLVQVLGALGIDPRFIDAERAQMADYQFAKTVNRSVVGTMTEFAFLAGVRRDHEQVDDLVAWSLWMAGTPCGPLRTGNRFPDLELAALVSQLPGHE